MDDNSYTDDGKILRFKLKDKLNGAEITPDNISLKLLQEFSEQVGRFLRGNKSLDLGGVKTSIAEGSFGLAIDNTTGLLDEAVDQYKIASENEELVDMDPVRAEVLTLWQESARKNPDRVYEVSIGDSPNGDRTLLRITSTSGYHKPVEHWMNIEKYIYGKIVDVGGKTKPNVHILLKNGDALVVDADENMLRDDNENRVYHNQLIRITAKKNPKTNELKDQRLVEFVKYNPKFDQGKFNAMTEKGKKAWSDVKDVTEWVEGERGNK